MSARFSVRHRGLDNLPPELSEGSLLILDDHIPFADHDPERIAADAARAAQGCDGILLDFQRKWDAAPVVQAVMDAAPCPVAVSSPYAKDLPCGVFLSPNLNIPLARAIAPWKGREIWLDVPAKMQVFTVDAGGCRVSGFLNPEGEFPFREALYDYRIEKSPDAVVFSLYRCPELLSKVLEQAEALGITKAVGLEQEYKKK